jgi:TolA-binding protein
MKFLATRLMVIVLLSGAAALSARANGNDPADSAGPANSAAPAQPAQPAAGATAASPAESRMEAELQELRDLLVNQGKQFQEQNLQLRNQLEDQQRKVSNLEEQLTAARSATQPAAGADPAGPANAALAPNVGIIAASSSNTGSAEDKNEPPTAIHIKGITLTPGGFMEGAAVWRQHALSSDVVTPFNTIPFGGASQAQMTEFNISGRQSRISMLVEGKLHDVKIGGYYETDFLGTGITSNYTESNSFVLRQRQFFGQAAFENGWTITGGQMWTLLTETRHGLDNRTEVLPLVIDGQYHVGFSWARQPGLRITKGFNNKLWLGFSVENAETTLTAHGQNNNFVVGQFGASGGLLNPVANFAYTTAPDFVFKAAFEPGWGHYEVFGVISTFRDRVFPNATAETPSSLGAFNDHRVGGGIGANARVPLFHKHLDAAIHFLGGDGIGRYGSATLADTTVRPNGTLAPIQSFQTMGELEWHTTPKLDIYAYAGGEYAGRTSYAKTVGGTPSEGYGAIGLANFGCFTEPLPGSATSTATGVGGAAGFVPGSLAECTGDTRNVIQGTVGYWYRFYQGPMGRIQTGMQYSYIDRNTWSGQGAEEGTTFAPHATENMVMASFRYYLP